MYALRNASLFRKPDGWKKRPCLRCYPQVQLELFERVQSVQCHTDLSWVSSDNPIKAVSRAGRPGSASAGTQASSGSTGPASADARVLRESAVEKRSKGLVEPLQKSATGSASVISAAGLVEPGKSAAKGLADPLKTVTGPAEPAKSVAKGSAADLSKTVRKSKGSKIPGRVKPRIQRASSHFY